MIVDATPLTIDLTRTPINENLLLSFTKEAASAGLVHAREALFAGKNINLSEDRAAHHTALRDPDSQHPHAIDARKTLEHTIKIANALRQGRWLGATGKRIEDIVHIGIGGSDLGPRMINAALARTGETPTVHFVANIDPADLDTKLTELSQETTLFIVASKSFNTLETLENGLAARRWLAAKIAENALDRHLIAITANIQRALDYGVARENILPMWEWVGGRYSLWSAIGLPIAIAVGEAPYRELLQGAHKMDQHFLHTPLNNNAPVLMAQLEVYYQRSLAIQSLAVLPYSHLLRLLPDYLQQLCMESNGKSVKQNGDPVEEATCPILWGSAGTVGQHSFHQLLHQGTQSFAIDLIMPLRPTIACESEDVRHQHLVANCLAQSQAFAQGKNFDSALSEVIASGVDPSKAETVAKQKVISGGKPHTIIAMEQVDPQSLGALIALYEHKTFVQSVIWGINAFDQWGVELGKQLSDPIYQAMSSNKDALNSELDPVTRYWVDKYNTYQT